MENEEKIIQENYGLANSITQKFYHKNSGLCFEDMLQVSLMGILKAHRNHDPQKSKFSTFATCCIRNDLIKFIKKNKEDTAYTNPISSYVPDVSISEYLPDSLTDTEKQIVMFLNSKFKNHEIRKKLNMKKTKYEKTVRSLLKKIAIANG